MHGPCPMRTQISVTYATARHTTLIRILSGRNSREMAMGKPAHQRNVITVIDPDHVPELFCGGRFRVAVGKVCTLTFTHQRPKVAGLLDEGTPEYEAVVRARLLLPLSNLVALRDALNILLREHQPEKTDDAADHSIN